MKLQKHIPLVLLNILLLAYAIYAFIQTIPFWGYTDAGWGIGPYYLPLGLIAILLLFVNAIVLVQATYAVNVPFRQVFCKEPLVSLCTAALILIIGVLVVYLVVGN